MSWLRFDPRTKLFVLFASVLCTMFTPSFRYEFILVCMIAGLALLLGQLPSAFFGIALYGLIYGISLFSVLQMTGTWQAIFAAFFGLVNKVYPCGLMACLMIKTTKTGEFMAALYEINMPDHFVIPFAVMMRYLPVVKEDWKYIKDAMRMRGISPSIKNICTRPFVVIECLYVPLMMAASNTADELSIAAVTRGIESTNVKTSLIEIKFTVKDFIVMVIFTTYFIFGIIARLQ
ncbi:energy-coupling factor transporter transmembrane component T [Anaerocolumna sp. AGMB13025]|uniref:energy-coupling factor transporter transmembrane component T n=1 Tax=Anaerocolumna sp. AGMB13025 TaxID=3039116 RepID=UPI00241E8786|nr:energy-coupling factor transporter transmembrane component T [Anaerocolumna sp. AGMB13025]WFR58659.1 energy-coupling factor transporter transmembrane component T [Anaerocolumna sp. AGMB13025]